MAAVWSFCWLGHCSDFVTVQTWWWIGPVFVLIHHGHRLTSCVDVRWDCLYSSRKHQHPDDDARTGPRCHGLLVSFSLTVHYAPILTVVQMHSLPLLYIPVPPHPLQAAIKVSSKPKECLCTACLSWFHVVGTECPYSWAQSIYSLPTSRFLFLKETTSVWEELPLRRNSI